MTERAFIISKINEAANEIISLLYLDYVRRVGVDINGIITSAMLGNNYVERDDRNKVVGEWRSLFSFVDERFVRNVSDLEWGDRLELKDRKTLCERSLEIDRLIQVYLTL